MRIIQAPEITTVVREQTMAAGTDLEPDILDALTLAQETETSQLSKNVLGLLLQNAEIARREKIPLCQDTGVSVVFVEIGQDVYVDGDLEKALQDGVAQGYEDGYLRKSVCDPITRVNTGTNTPAVIHYEVVPGDELLISLLPKGCGSENMSGLTMLSPSAGIQGMIDFVVEQVVQAGPNPCPPVTVGVGMGGTFEKAALLAKKSLLRPLGQPHPREDICQLESQIKDAINEQGMGVHGFGGNHTSLAVHIESFPSHIASLPVAVNIQCHAHRHKKIII
jgi:fumarate hydratase subunit alpha